MHFKMLDLEEPLMTANVKIVTYVSYKCVLYFKGQEACNTCMFCRRNLYKI